MDQIVHLIHATHLNQLLTFNNNLNKQLSGMVFEEYYLLLFIQS